MDYLAQQVAEIITGAGFTHVVWLPDSALGPWEHALNQPGKLELVRVCREGEAWLIAAGLHLGGQRPLVMIQNTGLFESGDALRNVLFDLKLPIQSVIGYRSALVPNSTDSARHFTEPMLRAWGIDYIVVSNPGELPQMADHLAACQAAGKAGAVLIAEGRM